MGLRKIRKLWKVYRQWETVKVQAAREKVRETMKPGYSFKKTLLKGAKRALFALGALVGATVISFFTDGPTLMNILIEAEVHPAFVGVLVPGIVMLAEMAENSRKQKK